MSVKRTCLECHHAFDAFWRYEVCCQTCVNGGYNRYPSNDARAAYFTAHRTSTAAQVSRHPLSSRLIDVAALCFLRGLAMVGWVKRRLR